MVTAGSSPQSREGSAPNPTLSAAITDSDWTKTPNAILRCPALSSNAKVLYLLLLSRVWMRDAVAFPSQTTLAAEMGLSVETVRRALAELLGKRLVERQRRGFPATNCYRVMNDQGSLEGLEGSRSVTDDRSARSVTGDHQIGHGRPVQIGHGRPVEEDEVEQDEEKKTTTRAAARPPRRTSSAGDPRVTATIRAFCDEHLRHVGLSYPVVGGRDGRAIKSMPADYTIEQLTDAIALRTFFIDAKNTGFLTIPNYLQKLPAILGRGRMVDRVTQMKSGIDPDRPGVATASRFF